MQKGKFEWFTCLISNILMLCCLWNYITTPPRLNHGAALYIFGGLSKSRTLNMIYIHLTLKSWVSSVGPDVSMVYTAITWNWKIIDHTLILITLWLFFLWDIYSTLRDFNYHDYMQLVCDPFDICIFSKTLILDHEPHLELIFLIKHALLFMQNMTLLFFLDDTLYPLIFGLAKSMSSKIWKVSACRMPKYRKTFEGLKIYLSQLL